MRYRPAILAAALLIIISVPGRVEAASSAPAAFRPAVLSPVVFPSGFVSAFSVMIPGESAWSSDRDVALLRQLTDSLAALLEGRYKGADASQITSEIEALLTDGGISDTLALSDACYFTGIQYFQSNRFAMASAAFSASVRYREAIGLRDRRYSTGLNNLAGTLARAGDFANAWQAGLRALEARREISGADSSGLVNNYLNLASIASQVNDYEKAIAMAEAGLALSRRFPGSVSEKVMADLYHVIGLSLFYINDYSKSLIYCRQALVLYDRNRSEGIDSRILIHNLLANVLRELDQPEESEYYLRRGLSIEDGPNTQDKYHLYLSYAGLLADQGRYEEGERLLEQGVSQAIRSYGQGSREHITMLVALAGFVDTNLHNHDRSLALFDSCFTYVRRNPWDHSMRAVVTNNYARVLYAAGRYRELLALTGEADSVLPASGAALTHETSGDGADASWLSASNLAILRLRYASLNALAASTADTSYLRQAIATGRMIASVYDRRRLEMTEDESRTSLSSSSRDIYTGLVGNYEALYRAGGGAGLLNTIFEFTERSKMAAFLSSIREVNAARFSLPEELVSLDASIRRQTGIYRELIAREELKVTPDHQRLATWEGLIFNLVRSRDSLINIFEERYPAYYNLKYRSEVTPLSRTGSVIGRRANLLSYILTDSQLHIFISNSRHREIITCDIDSGFIASLHRFRELLTTMPATSDARAPFNEYMDLAYSLYRVLLEPALPYLRGDKIVISPDNILSYLPFEALITEEFRSPGLLYRDAPFALKRYRFSYIYSVTLSSETTERSRSFNNRLAAFAPTYSGVEVDDSLLLYWSGLRNEIRELPFAIEEASDAVRQCGGKAYLGEEAREDTFRRVAAGYKIIHLAMHALVDDRQPAFSKILFAGGNGGEDDGMLNTYEVYSLPLNAMLVVLSSCNTGVGRLVSGEGLLSLARGFLYAGSRSVVMSMWEVEDASASEVIRSFYKNMRAGQAKSSALRNARLKFLRGADQSRSHPYYWSTLVIYGDDTSLWYNKVGLYLLLLGVLGAGTLMLSMIYRGPRS